MSPIRSVLLAALAASPVVLVPVAQAQSQSQSQSQLTIYGAIALEAVRATNVVSNGKAGTETRLDNSPVTASRLGFRGREDLGDGLFATFDLLHGLSPDTGSQSNARFWNRGAYVGLGHVRYGTLTLGRQWNVNDDIMSRYFIFGGYAAFRFTEFGAISSLVDNAVKYVSPSWDGLTVRGIVAPGEGTTGRTTELALNYRGAQWEAGLSSRSAKALNGASDTLQAVGLSYTLGNWRVHGGHAQARPAASGLPKASTTDLGLVWTATPLLVTTLDYVARNQKGTGNDSHFWRVGAEYYLSKRTTLLGNLVVLNNQGSAKERFFGDGAAGLDQSLAAVGLRVTF